MSLKGTLEDLSIVELLQFPYAGRKTGKLQIDKDGTKAQLFYVDGKLVHAALNDTEGFDATVDIVGWDHGGFEFFPDQRSEKTTIEMDLHRMVMQALRVRDEKRFQVEKQQADEKKAKKAEPAAQAAPAKSVSDQLVAPTIPTAAKPEPVAAAPVTAPAPAQPEPSAPEQTPVVTETQAPFEDDGEVLDPDLREALKKIAQENAHITYLAVITRKKKTSSGDSQLVADFKKGTEDDWGLFQLRASLSALIATYAQSRGALKRVLIEDDMGIVTLTDLTETATLLVVTATGPSLGQISLNVNKWSTSLSSQAGKW